jgi:hypothetical protein
MSTLKGLLIIVTILAGGSSLAMALSESAPSNPPVAASGARNPAALQHLAQRGGMKRSDGAAGVEAMHNKGHYKSGQ